MVAAPMHTHAYTHSSANAPEGVCLLRPYAGQVAGGGRLEHVDHLMGGGSGRQAATVSERVINAFWGIQRHSPGHHTRRQQPMSCVRKYRSRPRSSGGTGRYRNRCGVMQAMPPERAQVGHTGIGCSAPLPPATSPCQAQACGLARSARQLDQGLKGHPRAGSPL